MESPTPTTTPIEEERRRWEIARAIVEANSGPMKSILEWTRKNPEAALAVAFASGLLIGFVARRD
ncbi:MAG: hypothetical protein HYU52_12490 [Acidobacteria bacterium]|nr:hypothetical protein [Acidobacteriota bacterium]